MNFEDQLQLWLAELRHERPVFHSEADFQHALACRPAPSGRLPCDATLVRWALTLALTMALGRKLALCGTATPPMRRLG